LLSFYVKVVEAGQGRFEALSFGHSFSVLLPWSLGFQEEQTLKMATDDIYLVFWYQSFNIQAAFLDK
jgi:hypothetical protein